MLPSSSDHNSNTESHQDNESEYISAAIKLLEDVLSTTPFHTNNNSCTLESCFVNFSSVSLSNDSDMDASKKEELMKIYLEKNFPNLISSNMPITHAFEYDEGSVCLRRRKLTLFDSLMDEETMKKVEIFLFLVDESDSNNFNYYSLGTTVLKKLTTKVCIKSKQTIHSMVYSCQKCRIVLWKRDLDERSHIDLLISCETYSVQSDKPHRELVTRQGPPKKKSKKNTAQNNEEEEDPSDIRTWKRENLLFLIGDLTSQLQYYYQANLELCKKNLNLVEETAHDNASSSTTDGPSLDIDEILGDIKEDIAETACNMREFSEEYPMFGKEQNFLDDLFD